MQINNFEELVEYASKVVSNEVEFEPVEFGNSELIIPLKVDGESWDKRMDVRHSHHMISLQEALDALVDECDPEVRDRLRPIARAEILEGSSDIQQYVTDFGRALVEGMTDKQKFATAVIGIAAAVGYFGYSRYLDYCETQLKSEDAKVVEMHQLSEHEETKRAILAPLRAVIENDPAKFSQYERPITKMANMLEEGDQMALVGEGYIEADVAKTKIKPKRTRSTATVSSCDGEYLVMKTDYSLGEYIVYLKKDGVPLKAYTSVLDDEEKKELNDIIATRSLEEDLPFSIDLQMSVEHTDKTIKHGVIVGIGAPRADKNIKLLSDLTK